MLRYLSSTANHIYVHEETQYKGVSVIFAYLVCCCLHFFLHIAAAINELRKPRVELAGVRTHQGLFEGSLITH